MTWSYSRTEQDGGMNRFFSSIFESNTQPEVTIMTSSTSRPCELKTRCADVSSSSLFDACGMMSERWRSHGARTCSVRAVPRRGVKEGCSSFQIGSSQGGLDRVMCELAPRSTTDLCSIQSRCTTCCRHLSRSYHSYGQPHVSGAGGRG